MSEKKLRKREEIPQEYLWKLEDMFASDKQWEDEVQKVEELSKDLAAMEGTLSKSGASLLGYLKKSDELNFYLTRVYVYANMRYHQDTQVSKYQGYSNRADALMVAASSAQCYGEPEILLIPQDRMEAFYQEEPELENYRRVLEEILRQKEHTLSQEQESILAEVGELAVSPKNIYSMFQNADLRFPYITDVEGNKIRITHGNFIEFLKSKDRSLRKQVFRDMYGTYKKWGNTIATTYISHLKQERFYAKMRNYSSVRAMHLDRGNISEAVYDNLIETVHKHLPALHKYMELRRETLGVEHLHMYDLYVPMVKGVERNYSFEEAKDLVVQALKPMGDAYVSKLKEGMDHGWIDVFENENKRSGAYSWGTYGTHPYVLLNHQGNLDDVFTLAHEMGHAMHTFYSNEHQPIAYADYLIFVAEVASTCNESLLMHYLLEHAEDENEKKYLINHYLEGFRTTLFRQTMFAEFEQIVHTKMANGETLTMEELNKIYYDLNVMYYGYGSNMRMDEEIAYEWMRIPHFYTSFYVYQYATGYSAAIAFSKKILEEGATAVERYITKFLSGGGSKDPLDLLQDAGVDMSSPQPIDDALSVFEEYLEQLAKVLD